MTRELRRGYRKWKRRPVEDGAQLELFPDLMRKR
jgi:hypothetical protein